MKRACISQPMNGLSVEEAREIRLKAFEHLANLGYDIVDIYNPDSPNETDIGVIHESLWYIGHSLVDMSKCDVIFFCKGWQNARGCRIEHLAAEEYGLEIIEEQ